MNQIKLFEKELNIIIEGLKILDPISIVLYGGYSRGEGGVINSCNPYNDFDILLIVTKRIKNSQLVKIEKELKKKINIKWIDFTQKTIKEISRPGNTVFYYDLKNYGKVLYGIKDVLNYIPEIKNYKIDKIEIDKLFSTRIWTFLGCFPEKSFITINGEESRFFKNQMSKAILSLVDVILIDKRIYTTLYSDKIPFIKKHYKDLYELSKWAYKEKLNPSSGKMSGEEVRVFYLKVVNIYFEVMISLISKTKTFSGLINHFRFSLDENIKNIYYKVFYGRSYMKKKLCMIYLTYSFIDNKYFKVAQKLHEEINGLSNDQTFDIIRKDLI